MSSGNDDFFSSLLNEDGVIQIGKFLYRINLETGLVAVLSEANLAEYADLVSMNKKNKNIRIFTTQDDVIDLAESGAESTAKSCGGIGGGTYTSYDNGSDGLKIVTLENGNVWRLNAIVEFEPLGVLFRLSSKHEIRVFKNESSTGSGSLVNSSNGILTVEMYCNNLLF